MTAEMPNNTPPSGTHSMRTSAALHLWNGADHGGRSRVLLRLDGVFEGLLGALLILSPIYGLALPSPASQPVVIGCGLLLLPLLPILWRAARAPRRRFVLAVAGANGLGALLLALWFLVSQQSFSVASAAFVLAVSAILASLATLQALAALRAS